LELPRRNDLGGGSFLSDIKGRSTIDWCIRRDTSASARLR